MHSNICHFTEGDNAFPYLNAAKQTPTKKQKQKQTPQMGMTTADDDDEEVTQKTTMTLTSEFDAKISKMKKTFTSQLKTMKEQNAKQQEENEKHNASLQELLGLTQAQLKIMSLAQI